MQIVLIRFYYRLLRRKNLQPIHQDQRKFHVKTIQMSLVDSDIIVLTSADEIQ